MSQSKSLKRKFSKEEHEIKAKKAKIEETSTILSNCRQKIYKIVSSMLVKLIPITCEIIVTFLKEMYVQLQQKLETVSIGISYLLKNLT